MEKEPLLIAAGSVGSRKINGEDKPFLIIDNEMNIEKVFSAAMRAQYVGDIFIRGDKPRLEYVLQSQIRKYNNSERTIKILPEKGCLIENIVLTLHNEVCHYPKPVERLEDIKWN